MVVSKTRTIWLTLTEVLTFYVPNKFLVKDKEQRQAWREKFALVSIIVVLSSLVIFTIGILPKLLCPEDSIYSWQDIWDKDNSQWVVSHGIIYDVEGEAGKQEDEELFKSFLGKDVSKFYIRKKQKKIDYPYLFINDTKEALFVLNEETSKKCINVDDVLQLPEYENKLIKCKSSEELTKPVGVLSIGL